MNTSASWKTIEGLASTTTLYTSSVATMTIFTPDVNEGTLASDYVLSIFNIVNLAVISQLISVFGIFTNVINIIVFTKIGFNDSINVSLLSLAISDLGCLVTLAWVDFCFNPLFRDLDLPFDPMDVQFLTGGTPHVTFTRVTSCITAFITLERCLCISMPMKIKQLFTPRRVAFINISIFTVLIISVFPIFYANRLGTRFYPDRNKTLIGLIFIENKEQVESISYTINNVLIPFSAYTVVVVCTATLVIKLRIKTKWRQKSISSEQSSQFTDRDQRVAKMVITLSTLFIVCFFPMTVVFIAMIIEPELSIDGRYTNIFFISASFAFIFESINSSLNIVFYYRMSSRYKAAVESWLKRIQQRE